MRVSVLFVYTVILILPLTIFAQDKKAFKRSFIEAEYFFLRGEYEEAAFLYSELLKSDPSNANLHFLTGACYLSCDGMKDKAVPHLEKAVTSVSPGYREGSYRETNAPKEAFFALGRAYHINNMFDEALDFYQKYLRIMRISDVAEYEYVKKQIEAVKLARVMIKDTIDAGIFDMGENINISSANYRAVLAEKDSILFYMAKKPFYNAILTSKKNKGYWSEPEIINEELEIDGNYKLCSVSFDGTELYISVDDGYQADIFVSYFKKGKWSPVVPLGEEINTIYNETHASVSKDKKTLYFTSDRPEGKGALDIYTAKRNTDGTWGLIKNMGNPVNTGYSEDTPFITMDDKTLYFSSTSHATMGGFDVFYSVKLPGNNWSYPANLGYPISTTDDDLFYFPINNGKQALYTSISPCLPPQKILLVDFSKEETERKYAFLGKIKTGDNLELDPGTVISVVETNKNQPLAEITPNTETGEYALEIPAGNYEVRINSEGYLPESENLSILPQHTSRNINLETNLMPVDIAEGKYVISKNIFFGFDSYLLSDEAKHELEKLYSLMRGKPEIYVEVTGHADAKGSDDYNMRLSANRARAVTEYLASRGISRERFISKAVGESGNIAINVNEDGTDNPEGRKYNRQAEINLVNNSDKNIVMEESLVPERLKPKADKSYYVILNETTQLLKDIPGQVLHNEIKLFETGNKFLYTAGIFKTKAEAVEYLNNVIDMEYTDSRIVTEEELNHLLLPPVPDMSEVSGPFTIQILALRNPVSHSHFVKPHKITRITGNDGINRYISGIYKNFNDASPDLSLFVSEGFHDAFINQIIRYSTVKEDSAINYKEIDFYYTVQLSATRKPIDEKTLNNIGNLSLNKGLDDFYRYSSGVFLNKTDAEKYLEKIKQSGFADAFIRKVGGVGDK